jgi:ribose transport system ATP-binding protein
MGWAANGPTHQQEQTSMSTEKLLELRGVGKRFGGTQALDNVDFDLFPGEVHGLVGENGAGKSTLMKILSGFHSSHEGDIIIRGKICHFTSTKDALAQGIGMIYQELSVIKTLSVAENIFLEKVPTTKLGFVDWPRMNREAKNHLEQLGLSNISVKAELSNYTVATRQMIEIAKVVFSGADIIIMDEPTSALSHNEIQRLFDFIRLLKSQNKGIVFISHFLEDVLEISDRVTVLRNGHKVITIPAKEVSKQELTNAILGKHEDVELMRQARPSRSAGTPVLEVRDLYRGRHLNGINFSVYKGEILGIYGSMGAGKTQLAECLFGMDHPDKGTILMDGKPVKINDTSRAKKLGIAYIPANRQTTLFASNEIFKNITVTHLDHICPGVVAKSHELEISLKQIKELGIRPPDPTRPVSSLSGGNQQKVVLGKWLTLQPRVLMLNDPTRGMDVGAKQEVMEIVESLRNQGVATILFSTEPELLIAYADRVVVLQRGFQKSEFPNIEVTKDLLLAYS